MPDSLTNEARKSHSGANPAGGQPVTIGSGTVVGVDAIPVTIEATLRGENGSPRILGLVGPIVREAYHRILSAFQAAGLPSPRGIPTINFLPASVPKSGSGFDLPMALALAGAAGLVPPERTRRLAAFGEISLQGSVLAVPGVVAVALAAQSRGWTTLLTARRCAAAAAVVPGMKVHAVDRLQDALLWLCGERELETVAPLDALPPPPPLDLGDLRGHQTPKLALLAAAAGRHNLLLVGPPGSGKSALLRRLPGLLPPADPEEALEILKIHTAHGAGTAFPWQLRPMRCPHHSSSPASLLGGGTQLRPGEVTLAQHGVLFLDELPEFRREALEGLRQPLEDGTITIGRVHRTVTLPADFLLVAAMNPCPCGYLGHGSRPCVCTPQQHQRYHSRISGPLLDRIDLLVDVPALEPGAYRAPADPRWSTAHCREQVLAAIDRQRARNRSGTAFVPNGRLADRMLERAFGSDDAVLGTLEEILRTYRLSGRARVRLMRIARTLADLDERDAVRADDVIEAAFLRGSELRAQA